MTFDYNAQPKETVERCNLCGAGSFARRDRRDRYGHEVSMSQCHQCGLRFINPRMTSDAYVAFYRDGHYRRLLSEFYGRPITAESIEDEQTEYADRLISLLGAHLEGTNVETLLDVGGSTGVVAEAVARQFDLDATVLEPSEAEAARAEARGLNVIRLPIEYLEPTCGKYDVVLLCQTIDHLLDIRAALETIKAMMNDGGLFFLDVVLNGPVKIDHPYDLDECAVLFYLATAGFEVLTSGPAGDGLHHYFVCGWQCSPPQ